MISPSIRTIKTALLTAAVTTITIGGTLYGAELKTQKTSQDQRQQQSEEITMEEKLHSLRSARDVLVSKKGAVEKQLRDFEARVEEREERKRRRTSMGREEEK
ncbi:hypothetical protein Egran_00925 [Elaphomyces granulatus]|uniref:Uncharacterized protein n=1 Tax=Elaphomyces granulatus TaxID=519963 RepID=A0A232M4L5_9EURO|nr:hypothetical protein Egran_00925 [Elaphomyces granulatus]